MFNTHTGTPAISVSLIWDDVVDPKITDLVFTGSLWNSHRDGALDFVLPDEHGGAWIWHVGERTYAADIAAVVAGDHTRKITST